MLIAAVREQPLPPLPRSPRALQTLLDAAHAHGVAAYVLEAMPDSVAVSTSARATRATARALQHAHDLAEVARVLDAAGLPWLVLKGPAAARLHRDPLLRSSRDLDVLVPGGRLAEAVEALENAQAVLLERNWPVLAETLPGELHLELPSRSVLDLHWHVVNDRRTRGQLNLSSGAMLSRRRTVDAGSYDQLEIPALSRADHLMHLCVHAGLSGLTRLIWLKDVERAASIEPPAWHVLVQRAREGRVAALVGMVLWLAAELLAAPVPRDVIDELLAEVGPPAAVRRGLGVLAKRAGPQTYNGGGSLLRLVSRTIRDETSSTLREVGRHGASWVWHLARPNIRAAQVLQDRSRPTSPMGTVTPGASSVVAAAQFYASIAAEDHLDPGLATSRLA